MELQQGACPADRQDLDGAFDWRSLELDKERTADPHKKDDLRASGW